MIKFMAVRTHSLSADDAMSDRQTCMPARLSSQPQLDLSSCLPSLRHAHMHTNATPPAVVKFKFSWEDTASHKLGQLQKFRGLLPCARIEQGSVFVLHALPARDNTTNLYQSCRSRRRGNRIKQACLFYCLMLADILCIVKHIAVASKVCWKFLHLQTLLQHLLILSLVLSICFTLTGEKKFLHRIVLLAQGKAHSLSTSKTTEPC